METLLNQTFQKFKADLFSLLGDSLLDIIIFGSVALHDFQQGKGDIDYFVITQNDLNEDINRSLFHLHDVYRSERNLLLYQLEGTFYPQNAVKDINNPFVGCYIGTTRRNWRTISSFQNSLMDLEIVNKHGIHLLNKMVEIYNPSKYEMHKEQLRNCEKQIDHIKTIQNNEFGFFISIIHWCARTIYYYKNDKITSKREACAWCKQSLELENYRDLFILAEDRRYPYKVETLNFGKIADCRSLLYYTKNELDKYEEPS